MWHDSPQGYSKNTEKNVCHSKLYTVVHVQCNCNPRFHSQRIPLVYKYFCHSFQLGDFFELTRLHVFKTQDNFLYTNNKLYNVLNQLKLNMSINYSYYCLVFKLNLSYIILHTKLIQQKTYIISTVSFASYCRLRKRKPPTPLLVKLILNSFLKKQLIFWRMKL